MPIISPCQRGGGRSCSNRAEVALVVARHAESAATLGWLERINVGHKFIVNNGQPLASSDWRALLQSGVQVVRAPNGCREGFAYLNFISTMQASTSTSPLRAPSVYVFTQARPCERCHRGDFAEWTIQLMNDTSQAQGGDARCLSIFPGHTGPRLQPYAFAADRPPAGGRFRRNHSSFRLRSICPRESWDTWAARSTFGPGAAFAASRSVLLSLDPALVRAVKAELVGTINDGETYHDKPVCWGEYALERSWSRLLSACSVKNEPRCIVPPRAIACHAPHACHAIAAWTRRPRGNSDR